MRFKQKRKRRVAKPTEEIVIIVEDTARFRIHLYKRGGKGELINFIYQLETTHNNKWKPVIRYNNFHGFIHKDFFDPEGNRVRRKMLGRIHLNEATKIASIDLRTNYKKYIEEFIQSDENEG